MPDCPPLHLTTTLAASLIPSIPLHQQWQARGVDRPLPPVLRQHAAPTPTHAPPTPCRRPR